MKKLTVAALLLLLPFSANAETPDEWVTLGARVHAGFGAFIPLGLGQKVLRFRERFFNIDAEMIGRKYSVTRWR